MSQAQVNNLAATSELNDESTLFLYWQETLIIGSEERFAQTETLSTKKYGARINEY